MICLKIANIQLLSVIVKKDNKLIKNKERGNIYE